MMRNWIAFWMLLVALTPLGLACQGKTTACKSNLKNLATALEMYASDHQGHYPDSLQPLVTQNYLKTIPLCPEARCDTYSCSYQRLQSPDLFVLCCAGNYHRKLMKPNYPAYSSDQGLLTEPAEENSPEPCQKKLAAVGRALDQFHRQRGHYPKKLEELCPEFFSRLPACPAGPLVLAQRQGQLQLSCPGHAHLDQGYEGFQPAWVAGQGISLRRLPTPPPHPDTRRINLQLAHSLLGSFLLLALSLRSQSPRQFNA